MNGAIGGMSGGTDAIVPQAARRRTRLTGFLSRRPNATVVALCALAAAALDGLQLSRPGYLVGSTADIAVYLGAAVRLVHGVVPYRDFVLVQPPGITLLLSPAGLLSDLAGTRAALTTVRLGAWT